MQKSTFALLLYLKYMFQMCEERSMQFQRLNKTNQTSIFLNKMFMCFLNLNVLVFIISNQTQGKSFFYVIFFFELMQTIYVSISRNNFDNFSLLGSTKMAHSGERKLKSKFEKTWCFWNLPKFRATVHIYKKKMSILIA